MVASVIRSTTAAAVSSVDEFSAALDVLHVPFTYFPDPVGGTEIYVAGLTDALRAHGIRCAVAAPAQTEASYEHDDIPVYRFATTRRPTIEHAYGAPDDEAASAFRRLIDRLRPQIVHLHAQTAAVSEALVGIAHAARAKVVFTYHTPAVSCVRGTMMRMGRVACDGKLETLRCSACVMAQHGVPPILRDLLARTPQSVGVALERAGLANGPFTALRLPALIAAAHRRFRALIAEVDHIVVVADWVRNVLRVNGVAEEKLSLCRHGLNPSFENHALPWPVRADGPSLLRLGYFGRLDPTKGIDVLIEALGRAPDLPVELKIYGVRQAGSATYVAMLETAAAADPRIRMQPPLPAGAVIESMRQCDFVVVPSRWLETGPLVVLEAFAAGTPVLGTRLGGIADLVTDGVDGVLVAGADSDLWAAAIRALANEPARVERLRASVRPPRRMDEVAGEMAALYRTLLARRYA